MIFPKEKGEFIFPIADGRIKHLGGDQELRTSTLVRHRPIQGDSNIDFLGESEGSVPQPQDSFPDAGEAINYFWWLGRWGPQGMPDRRWTNQTPWRRSGPENIHFDTAATNSRRKSR